MSIFSEREQLKEKKCGQHQTKWNTCTLYMDVNPFTNDKISDTSKLKVFADDNFELDENGWKFCKRVENTA